MFTDKEHRILLSAMARELEVCKRVDKEFCREPDEETLESVCESINRKIHDIQHKYKWHDLRENPDDLPEHYNDVLCMTNSENKQFRYCIIPFGSNYWSNRIIKWKEIEHEGNEDDSERID